MNLKELIKEVKWLKDKADRYNREIHKIQLQNIKQTVEAVDNDFTLIGKKSPTYHIIAWRELKELLGIK